MTIRTHISLPVRDLDRSVAFYEALLGQPPSKVREGYANWRVDEPGLMLALVEDAAQAPGDDEETKAGASHYGFEVDDLAVLDERQTRLTAAGEQSVVEAGAECCYASAEKVWTVDPDGRPWELWVKTGDVEVMRRPGDGCCPTSAEGERAAPPTEEPAGRCCG